MNLIALEHQVPQQPLELNRVHLRLALPRQVDVHLDAFLSGRQTELVHVFQYSGHQVQPALLQLQLPGLGLGQQQQRLDDLSEALDVVQRGDDGIAVLALWSPPSVEQPPTGLESQ